MPSLSVDVCLSPALFPFTVKKKNQVVVVVDVFRATTSMIAAFDHGVHKIIPLVQMEEALAMKKLGFLVAGERDGIKLDFADFGNSPPEFETNKLAGKTIAFISTNGTRAIRLAAENNQLVLGAFSNLSAMSKWLLTQEKDVLILCAGWKNRFSLEDTLCAGAITEQLLSNIEFRLGSDAASATLDLWSKSKNYLQEALENAEHAIRLKELGQGEDIFYCTRLNNSTSVPIFQSDGFVESGK